MTFNKAFKEGSAADRFVWCWAWMPLLVFSLSHGKHHHYMLHYLGTVGDSGAGHGLGLAAYADRWRKLWVIPVMIAIVADVGLALALREPYAPCRLVLAGGYLGLFPLLVLGGWWFADESSGQAFRHRRLCACICHVRNFLHLQGRYLHRSREDTAFLREVRRRVPLDQPLMINSADEALEGLRMQFYIGDSVYFLHNLSFVLDNRIGTPDLYVVTRYNRMPD